MRRLVIWSLIVALGLGVLAWAQAERHWVSSGATTFSGGVGQAVIGNGSVFYVLRQATREQGMAEKFRLRGGQLFSLGSFPPPPERMKAGTALALDPDGNLYAMLGGAYGDEDVTGRHFFFRYNGILWTKRAPSNIEQGPADAMTFVRVGEREYFYTFVGAATRYRPSAKNLMIRYHIAGDRWEEVGVTPWPCIDGGAALAWDGGQFVYALQGGTCSDEPSDRFSRFNLANEEWEPLLPAPEVVYEAASLLWDGADTLYATVGVGGNLDVDGKGVFRYELSAQRWEAESRLPCPIGWWPGNRLALDGDRPFVWQGTPSNWQCGGAAVLLLK